MLLNWADPSSMQCSCYGVAFGCAVFNIQIWVLCVTCLRIFTSVFIWKLLSIRNFLVPVLIFVMKIGFSHAKNILKTWKCNGWALELSESKQHPLRVMNIIREFQLRINWDFKDLLYEYLLRWFSIENPPVLD